jgi:PIN domain nuclease of toxin-antitoxin system
MKLLLDTHLLLWAANGFDYLPSTAQLLMSKPENELYFSVASLWERQLRSLSLFLLA